MLLNLAKMAVICGVHSFPTFTNIFFRKDGESLPQVLLDDVKGKTI